MTLLLDPRLLTPPGQPDSTVSASAAFWTRILGWATDKRAKLGEDSHSLVCSGYAVYGYPDHDLPLAETPLKREYRAALNRILARVELHVAESGERAFTPSYLGTSDEALALQLDVSGTYGAPVIGIATASNHWSDIEANHVKIIPPPPTRLALCCLPGAEVLSERQHRIANFYVGLRIHIVGAIPSQRIMEQILEVTGMTRSNLSWIPCEKSRPPRNLDDRWRHLEPSRDVTVCITGRVGHATSNKAQRVANHAGVIHLKVELPSQLPDELAALALRQRTTSE
jgi:hypothetical protein